MSKVDRATDLLYASEDADCFPMAFFRRECTFKELSSILEKGYCLFKSRHSSLRLGPIQFQRSVLGVIERMERELSPEGFDEENYRVRSISPLMDLLISGFQRLSPFVNNQNK